MGAGELVWWGHSTCTVEVDGVRLLTDPVLTVRIGHLYRRRGVDPGVSARRADAVLVSHLHADHLHLPSLRALPDVPLLVPRDTPLFLRDSGYADIADRCVEMDPGSETDIGAVTVRAVPARHSPRRTAWSRHSARPLGYVVAGTRTVWFPGDTDLFDGMSHLGHLDAALLPVGGWGPTLGPGHLDPPRAAEAVRRATPGLAVPIHSGTFWPMGMDRVRPHLFMGPEREFADLVEAQTPTTRVETLPPGASLPLP